ncbi:UNVERIFIED_ORG: hypothetical protein ABIB13_002613 [Arthrobacter sp. UYEF2]
MASRALARVAAGPDDYLHFYSTLLQEVDQPVILHWLGTMFDPALAGYWGSDDVAAATETFLSLIRDDADKVDGVKVSLLDASHEVALRAVLPEGVRLYTGDDFNYPELIDGDGSHHSDALLGIFAAIYPAASVALQHFDAGKAAEARAILDSTRELGKHIFSPHVLLQDRDRLYVLAQRQAARLPDGGRPALRPLRLPPGQDLRTGRPGRAAEGSCARRVPDVRLPAHQRSGSMTLNLGPSPFSRLSINSATTKKWTLAQVVDGCVNAGIPSIGPWRDRVE